LNASGYCLGAFLLPLNKNNKKCFYFNLFAYL